MNQKYSFAFRSNKEVELLSQEPEPMFDVAQLAHLEILSPKPEESIKFFTDLLGMEVTARKGQSVYLRAYEDFYQNTLKITESNTNGLGHVAWRTSSPQALLRRAKALEESGYGTGWIEGDEGHGVAYQFKTPAGHNMEVFWDVDYYVADEDQKSYMLNRPQKRPARGVPVRRLDHVNLTCPNTDENLNFMMDYLGMRLREKVMAPAENRLDAAWLSVTNLVHDIALMTDPLKMGRMNHFCYWYGHPQHLWDFADLCKENGIVVELGPRRHSITQALCMYVFEPGGNRVEVFGDAGYLIFDPSWTPVEWNDMKQVDSHGIGGGFKGSSFLYQTPSEKKPEDFM